MVSVVETIFEYKNIDYKNYLELVNISFPLIFYIEIDNKSKIGYFAEYAPLEGIISFSLSDIKIEDIVLNLKKPEPIIKLFQENLDIYSFINGKVNIENQCENIEEFLPNEELIVTEVPFNHIDLEEVFDKLKKLLYSTSTNCFQNKKSINADNLSYIFNIEANNNKIVKIYEERGSKWKSISKARL
ncbi:hypothetical protein ACS60K_07705 [Streptococcus suis]